MAQCATSPSNFPARQSLPLAGDFFGGRLTSDDVLARLAEADAPLGLTSTLAGVVPDWRTRRSQHAVATLLAQRFNQVACGY